MEVGGASQDFMQYVKAIEQASFGSRSKPIGVEEEVVSQISKSANNKQRNDNLEGAVSRNRAQEQAMQAASSPNNGDVYGKNGSIHLSKGASFSIEV